MTNATEQSYAERLETALPRVRERIAGAAHAAGRDPASIRLIAVTKSHPHAAVEAALAAGLVDLGENRLEELEGKVDAFGRDAATWHMIGHVQSRKADRVVGVSDLVHSVDTTKLARKMARAAVEQGVTVTVLAQVNSSGEVSKSGFSPDRAVDEILELAELPGLEVRGLMTMAPFVDDAEVLAQAFRELRSIQGKLHEASERVGPELSMGMTNDLEIAIREGSTMVRVGTALFGPR